MSNRLVLERSSDQITHKDGLLSNPGNKTSIPLSPSQIFNSLLSSPLASASAFLTTTLSISTIAPALLGSVFSFSISPLASNLNPNFKYPRTTFLTAVCLSNSSGALPSHSILGEFIFVLGQAEAAEEIEHGLVSAVEGAERSSNGAH